MVKFKQRLDRNSKIYITKPLREMGFDEVIEIRPNSSAAVMYPAGMDLKRVIQSLGVILHDLRLQVQEAPHE